MQSGRIVTEHVVRPKAWYLDGGRIVPSIAIEAGQADLLLCGYLGVDFETQGPGRLPAARRDRDVSQRICRAKETSSATTSASTNSSARARRFSFGSGSMRRLPASRSCRCATAAQAFSPRKSWRPAAESSRTRSICSPVPGVRRRRAPDLVPRVCGGLEPAELEALRRGDLAGAFGPPFDRLVIDDPLAAARRPVEAVASRDEPRRGRRLVRPGVHSCGGRDSPGRLVPGLPLRGRSRDARHAHVSELSRSAADLVDAHGLDRPPRARVVSSR